jgi:hypothetical protein
MDITDNNEETRTQYVIRRAREVKRYRESADAAGVGYEWLCKLVRNGIKSPGAEPIDKAYAYYQGLERLEQEARAAAEVEAQQPQLQLA